MADPAQDDAMHRTFATSSPEATEVLGGLIGRVVPAGATVTLDGDLGTGKTTFVRGLARGLGIEDGVSSPTYTLMQVHEGGRLPLYHFDAWMEGREKALLAEGADEFLGRDGVAVVEWSERVAAWLPSPRLAIRIQHRTPETRVFELRVVPADAHESTLEAALRQLVAGIQPTEGLVESPKDAPATENL